MFDVINQGLRDAFFLRRHLHNSRFYCLPFTSIIHEKNIMVRRYVIGSRLASKAISAFPQPNTAFTVPDIGPNAFHAMYCENAESENMSRI